MRRNLIETLLSGVLLIALYGMLLVGVLIQGAIVVF